jgi:uncharacterized protein
MTATPAMIQGTSLRARLGTDHLQSGIPLRGSRCSTNLYTSRERVARHPTLGALDRTSGAVIWGDEHETCTGGVLHRNETDLVIPPRLTVVTLGARDLPALRRFYLGLGWPEVDGSHDGWAAFLLGGTVLALFPDAALDEEASSTGTGRGGFTLALNVDEKMDVDSTFALVVEAGARILARPQDRSWGGRSAYVADPEGNRWEIAWAPGLVLGERGEVLAFGTSP